MVHIDNLKMPFLSRLNRVRPSEPVWPRTLVSPIKRSPPRAKIEYRARPTLKPSLVGPAQQVTIDHRSIWIAHTADVAKRKRLHKQCAMMIVSIAIASVGVLLAGAVVLPHQAPVSIDIARNTATAQTSVPTLVSAIDINLGPTLPTAPARASTPNTFQTVLRIPTSELSPEILVMGLPQPMGIMERAPMTLRSPRVPSSPKITIASHVPPRIMKLAVLTSPQVEGVFDCQACSPAFPQFESVIFEVQASDITATRVQEIMAALAPYQSNLRPSAIAIASSQVRFYRVQDAQAAAALASLYNAELVDLTWFSPQTEIAKIDVLIARQNTSAADADGL